MGAIMLLSVIFFSFLVLGYINTFGISISANNRINIYWGYGKHNFAYVKLDTSSILQLLSDFFYFHLQDE